MKKINVKALIFDLDGVLVFTDNYHYLAWKKMADELGVYFDRNINSRLKGVSRMASLDIVLEKYNGTLSLEDKNRLAIKKNEYYKKLLEDLKPSDVSDIVRKTLSSLKERGFKLAVGSSSKNAKFILDKTDLIKYFDAISDGTNISKSKPDPEVFLKASEFLNISPIDCAVIEDAKAGIDAAKAANMYAIGIGEASLYDRNDIGIKSFDELLNVITKA